MSALYEDSHRQPEARFDTQRLADRIEQRLFRTALTDEDKAVVERSKFVPHADCETPAPGWKQMDWARDVRPQGDPAGVKL
jgi:hypothetical protein